MANDPYTQQILDAITGGASSTSEAKDIEQQLAVARALQQRRAPTTVSAGARIVPNYGGAIRGMMDKSQGASDEARLLEARRALEAQATAKGRAGIDRAVEALSGGPTAIEGLDGESTPLLGGGTDPNISQTVNSRLTKSRAMSQRLHGALDGLDPATSQNVLSGELLKRALPKANQIVPRGSAVIDENGQEVYSNDMAGGTGGGQTALLQIADRIKQVHPELSDAAALEQARVMQESLTTRDVAGVQTLISNKRGSLGGMTSIAQVADNARAVKEAEEAGKVSGKIGEERVWKAGEATSQAAVVGDKLNEFVSKAERISNDPALGRTVGIMSYVPSIRGGRAANLESAIDTLKVDIGLNELLALKSAGGTLGQVTEQESKWLQNSVEALHQEQSPEQFKANVQRIIDRAKLSRQRILAAAQAQTQAPAGRALPKATGASAPSAPAGRTAAQRAAEMGL